MTNSLITAKEKILNFITENGAKLKEDPPVIIDEKTVELSWGWLFYYNGTKCIETGDDFYSYMGNLPLIYDRIRDEIEPLLEPPIKMKDLIKRYEAKHGYLK